MATRVTTQDASKIAKEAFVLAYPLVVMHLTMAQATAVPAPEPDTLRAPLNAIVHGRDTPDTLRVSGWLELADEPVVLSVPDTHGRYYALWLRDAWTTVFASVGARTTGTTSNAFALLGPGSNGRHVPPELPRIVAPTRTVHIGGCIEAVHESSDEARDGFHLTPLSAWHCGHAPASPPVVGERELMAPVEQVDRMDARAFFSAVSRLIENNPPDPMCRAALDRLQDIGAGGGSLAPHLRASVERGLREGREVVRGESQGRTADAVTSWRICSEFGDADALRRVRVARSGLRADPAMDVLRAELDGDADGRPLTGGGRYLLRFAPDASPPVHGFWSLEARGGGPDHAHSVGDRRGLAIDTDGSLPVYIQHRPPARRRKPNWLPAPASGFSVALHLYWPRDEALQRRWSPPLVTRVE